MLLKLLKELDDMIYYKKLENGLSILEINSYILLFLYTSSEKDIKNQLKKLMKLHNITLTSV